MKEIFIELDGSWVFKHRNDEVLPIQTLIDALPENYRSELKSSSLTTAVFVVDEKNVNSVSKQIKELFTANFTDADVNEVMTIDIIDAAAEKGEQKTEKKAERGEDEEDVDRIMSDIHRLMESLEDFDEEDEDKKEQPTAKSCANERINALVGAEEFKALCEEITALAPVVKRDNMTDVFFGQCYLYSVNDGCGFSEYVRLFAELVNELGLRKTNSSHVYEFKPGPIKDVREPNEPFESIDKFLRLGSSSGRVLCVDISEWMDKADSKPFKDFLRNVAAAVNDCFVVFRVPFLEKDVLEKLRFSLNDMMFIRTVTIAPFTVDEVRAVAANTLAKYGFAMAENAWSGFERRLSEEKSDGKFYGLKTVNKVIRELLYKKQLTNVNADTSDKTVTADDTALLCVQDGMKGVVSGYDMLMKLVGSEAIKTRVDEIVAQVLMAKKSEDMEPPCLHMRFVGNPGTGKTTVARIIGKIFKEKGILRIGNFYEYSGRDFCGRYIGETAPKTASMCRDAYGSVLFIDEAYSLYRGFGETNDFGREALDTLIAEMENHRSDLVVIMAGYRDDMNKLMSGNVGLASRMPYTIEFPNFTREELYGIFEQLTEKFKCDEKLLPVAKAYFDGLTDECINAQDFSNARFVRNLFERTWAKAVTRCQLDKSEEMYVTADDFERASKEKDFDLTVKKKTRIGFGV